MHPLLPYWLFIEAWDVQYPYWCPSLLFSEILFTRATQSMVLDQYQSVNVCYLQKDKFSEIESKHLETFKAVWYISETSMSVTVGWSGKQDADRFVCCGTHTESPTCCRLLSATCDQHFKISLSVITLKDMKIWENIMLYFFLLLFYSQFYF